MNKRTMEILKAIEDEIMKTREEGLNVVAQRGNKDIAKETHLLCEATRLSGKADGLMFAYKTICLLSARE